MVQCLVLHRKSDSVHCSALCCGCDWLQAQRMTRAANCTDSPVKRLQLKFGPAKYAAMHLPGVSGAI
jgi:hypothetical protein